MKKLLLLLLALVCLTACGKPEPPGSVSTEPEPSPEPAFDLLEYENPAKMAKDQQYRDGFTYSVYVDHVSITGYNGTQEDVVIPQEIDGIPVTVVSGMFAPTVTSVTLPEGLKYLALSSFAFCADLTWLDLPASLESLTPADAASENYLHLRLPEDSPYLTMEDGVLFDKAMETLLWFPRNRSGEYTLPETVKAIGTYTFCLCNIQSVTLPEGLLEIRAGAFYDCHQLETLSLPASLTTLTQESLLGCESLRSVDISAENPNYVSVDGVLYSRDMTELYAYPPAHPAETFTLPEGVTQGWQLLFMAQNLKTIHLPDSIQGPGGWYLPNRALQVYYHGSAESWMLLFRQMLGPSPAHIVPPENPPEDWTVAGDFAYTVEDDQATLRAYLGSNCEIQLPDTLDGFPVTAIGPDALAFYSAWQEVTDRESGSITGSGGAVLGITETCRVTVPEGVTSIGDRAFYGSRLSSLTLPSTLRKMGDQALAFCNDLAELSVSEENPSFRALDGALYTGDMTTLLHVSARTPDDGSENAPHPAGSSADHIFRKEYTLPASVTAVRPGAFLGCTWLETFFVAEGNPAFAAEKGSLTTLDGQALIAYPPGTEIGQVPETVTKLAPWSFGGVRSMPDRMRHLLAHVTELSENAFAFSGFSRAVLPEAVTKIPERTFFGSSITEAVIPAGVTEIGADAFAGCTQLEAVTYGGTQRNWDAITIAPGNDTLHTAAIAYNANP